MKYRKLRELVGSADAEARLARALQCYNAQLAEGLRSEPLTFNEKDISKLVLAAAWYSNRYGFYTPSSLEKISHYCTLKIARASARAHYANKNLDYYEVNRCVGSLRAAIISRVVGKILKKRLSKKTLKNLGEHFKSYLGG